MNQKVLVNDLARLGGDDYRHQPPDPHRPGL